MTIHDHHCLSAWPFVKDSAFWAPVCRLALADYKAEVQELLKGVAHRDQNLGFDNSFWE